MLKPGDSVINRRGKVGKFLGIDKKTGKAVVRLDRGIISEAYIEEYKKLPKKENKGTKDDSCKPDLTLLPYSALEGISKALMFGEKKYGRYNYLGGMKWSRLAGAGFRHLGKFIAGHDYDEESGLNHLYHCGACIMMLIDYFHRNIGEDNRYKNEKS